MSGIAGIIRFDGAPVAPGLVESMTAAMPYRGPDGIHHWVSGPVALGQCMLHTTPESLEESQPLTNEDESVVLVMDGRVDNWEALRRELQGRGAVLRDRSDAELVLRAYETWGQDSLQHIDGDFALVIWDARRRAAFCARDRLGHKPFNYSWDGKTFVFASELHAILGLPGIAEVLNEGLLAEFLANEWYSRDETFWNGVSRLVAAHRMWVDAGGVRIGKYWRPDLWATLPCKNDEEYIAYYRELLGDVVRRLSRSHRSVAFEVSGGLDSSALFAMAEHLRRDQRLPAPALAGYALDFHDDPQANELEYSRAVAHHLGVAIHEIPPTHMPVSWYRDWAERYREFPAYPNSIMAIGLREAAGQAGCRASVSGTGGDEWLAMSGAGAYYAEALAARQWSAVYACLKADSRDLGLRKTLWWLCRYGVAPLLPEQIKAWRPNLRGLSARDSWLSANLQETLEKRRSVFSRSAPPRLRRRGQRIRLQVLEGAFDVLARELEERLCSSQQLETRNPLNNEKIIQFAFSTPEWLRARGYTSKWLHRQALKGLLPAQVLNRVTKAEFSVVFHRHLDRMNGDLENDIVSRRTAWIQPRRAIEIYGNYHEVAFSGWAEWWMWSLVGCDALFMNRELR
jgi:asparagine synthase (glutamine-hydrolysing)